MNQTKAKEKLAILHKIAEAHDGESLTTTFTSPASQYSFRCKEGHEWSATFLTIQRGAWCPVCRKKAYGKKQLALLQSIAEEKGGNLLSTTYIDSYHRLEWQCKEGHTWKAMPGAIKNGSWCSKCQVKDMIVKKDGTIEKMKELACTRGGDCISTEYVTSRDKLTWQCAKGHTWKAEPYSIRRGHWCPDCSPTKKNTIEQMRRIAESRGGKCLSTSYQNKETKLTWQCDKGHIWEATGGSVHNRKTWCPTCVRLNRPKRSTIDDMKDLAALYNGSCLSRKFVHSTIPLIWKCENGHKWEATSTHVKAGNWCSECNKERRRREMLEYYQNIAIERGGKCLTKAYVNATHQLEWECAEGHRWKGYSHNIVAGTWCPTCSNRRKGFAKNPSSTYKDIKIEDMDALAKKRGGRCLSSSYVNKQVELKWMCKNSHAWYSTPALIERGSWCPICRKKDNPKIQKSWGDALAIAHSKGGRCVSKEYINNRTKLEWECKEGHRWETTPQTIKKGSWCPTCALRR